MKKYTKLIASLALIFATSSLFAYSEIHSLNLPKSAEEMTTQCNTKIAIANQIMAELKHTTNVSDIKYLSMMDNMKIHLSNMSNIVELYTSAHPDKNLRDSALDCSVKISRVQTSFSTSDAIYYHLKSINPNVFDIKTVRSLDKTIYEFEQAGVNLEFKKKQKLSELNAALKQAGSEFKANISNDQRSIAINLNDPYQVSGLPKDFINRLKDSVDDCTGASCIAQVTTDKSTYRIFMAYADNDELRKKLFTQYQNIGYPQSEALLKTMVKLRAEIAELMGYADWADYATQNTMIAKTQGQYGKSNYVPNIIQSFLDATKNNVMLTAEQNLYDLLTIKHKKIPNDKTPDIIQGWQLSYLETARLTKIGYDSKQIRTYLPFNRVKQGVLDASAKLFGIEFQPWLEGNAFAWHSSVEAYQMLDKVSHKVLGYFYLDLHPRDGKFKGASHIHLVNGINRSGNDEFVQKPISVLETNFSTPNFPEDLNSGYMEQKDVKTFFHEFGHLIHQILGSNQPWMNITGIATESDFVEAPSKLLERWAWNAKILNTFARNKLGERIPQDLVSRMNDAANVGSGITVLDRLYKSELALKLYTQENVNADVMQLLADSQQKYLLDGRVNMNVDGTHFPYRFNHLESYTAKYYTYAWSDEISKKLFDKFEHGQNGRPDNLLNPETGMKYRKSILEHGGSQDATVMVENFLTA